MGKECSTCHKELGLFDTKRKCAYCARTLCNSCAQKLEESDDFFYYYEMMELPHANNVCPDKYLFGLIQKDTFACMNCYIEKFLKIKKRLREAIDSRKPIELLPISYRGKRNTLGRGIEIESEWHRDWSDCDKDLEIQARYYQCDCVMHIQKIRESKTEELQKDNGKGTYIHSYSIWKKMGTAYPYNR